jgi:putative ABC transport system permease protein
MFDVSTMDEIVGTWLATRRFAMILLGVFATLALVLSAIGIYGVISYMVGQRTHEMGIRMTLGARRTDILRLILGQGGRLALLGIALGTLGAFSLGRLMAGLLYGVSASDPLTLVAAATLLMLVALAACYVPARRATRVDPLVSLRSK